MNDLIILVIDIIHESMDSVKIGFAIHVNLLQVNIQLHTILMYSCYYNYSTVLVL